MGYAPSPLTVRTVYEVGRGGPLPAITVTAVGEVDPHNLPRFRDGVRAAVRAYCLGEACSLRLDLSGIDFMDESGLAVLMGACQRTDAAGKYPPTIIADYTTHFGRKLRTTRLGIKMPVEFTKSPLTQETSK